MGNSYTRQSSFSDGDTINSGLFNDEYDQLVLAFSSTTGHTHDGSTGEGAAVTKVGPAQDVVISGTTILPKTSNAIDLGSSTYKFKDAYFGGNITADGSITYNGNVVLGSDATDTVTINGTIQGGSLLFEGATVDGFETTLAIPDATADITITLPNATDTLVGKATTDTLTNKTLTTPVISSISNTGTITLPTSTDTLVGRATTDTLTNKTLTTPVISSISNTGTVTLPTSTDTLVGRATTDTLTNKTLTTPVISSISNTGTVTLPTSTDTLVGRATTDTLTNKTLTSPKIGTNLSDTNGNELLKVTATTSAVNELTLANAATAAGPTLSATGGDTNIDINLTPKGTGEVNITKVDINGGTIDGSTIATSDVTVGTGKTLNVSAGTLTTSSTQKKAIVEGAGSNVDIGAYSLTAKTLVSDVAVGIAPITVTSTTVVTNLNADKLDGADLDTAVALGTSDTKIPSQKAVKTYVDAQVDTADTLAEMNDTTITTPADSHFLVHNGTNWINETGATARASLGVDSAGTINYTHPNHSGDVTSTADGATVISAGAVDIAMLSATGTAGATTFLRGDNTWVVPTDTDTNTNQLTTFTVSATTDTTPTTISQGDDLMFTAGTGITCETTADGTVTISNTVTDTDTVYTHPTTAGNEHLPSSVSQTEAGYLDGVTSGIQTQLGAKLPLAGGTITGDLAIDGDTTLAAYNNTAAITGNAVDVFIYDTSNDSDGGAWRKRTQATSWYNETLNTSTRGSRKEFPSVAVIVAESSKVTIYDGDTPDLDMWMVFNATSYSSVLMLSVGSGGTVRNISALNGIIGAVKGGASSSVASDGINLVSFINDTAKHYSANSSYKHKGSILDRNSLGYSTSGLGNPIVNHSVNDVAMTVLPNAPIDSATGLPIPTIAVATDGGVSVIKDDGTVVDLTYTISSVASGDVVFTDRGLAWSSRFYTDRYIYVFEDSIPSADKTTIPDRIYGDFNQAPFDAVTHLGTTGVDHITADSIGNGNGLTKLAVEVDPNNSMASYLTSTYNTGYMTGDIKGAWLSDTDTTSLGTELGGNGTFGGTARLASHTYTSGDLTFSLTEDSNTGTSEGYVKVNFNGVIGRTYSVDIQCDTAFTATNDTRLETVTAPVTSFAGQGTTDLRSLTFTQTSSLSGMYLYGSPVTGSTVSYTISVKLADADRSVNNNGLQVHGTITKTAVA